jgi:uncharacterized protein involved in exopolysaccharide biosynthesis
LTAAVRHPFLTILPAILLAALGIAVGIVRTPTYTAESRVSVTKLDAQTQALPGFAAAAEDLASAYARILTADKVNSCVARTSRALPADAVATHLVGSPIPQSPIIRVIATGSSDAEARTLATDGGKCLVSYVKSTVAPDAGTQELAAYNRQNIKLIRRRAQLADASAAYTVSQSDVDRRKRDALQAQVDQLALLVSSLGARYRNAIVDQQQIENVQLLSRATPSTDDRLSKLAILAFAGAVAGLLLGVALASLRESRRG